MTRKEIWQEANKNYFIGCYQGICNACPDIETDKCATCKYNVTIKDRAYIAWKLEEKLKSEGLSDKEIDKEIERRMA